jgi:hypothetical protein
VQPVFLKPYSRVSFAQIFEPSGIIKSRKLQNVYWTHNDSGDLARIFAITRNGRIIKSPGSLMYRGITLKGAENVDWEDIAVDGKGNIYIADTGDNVHLRESLYVYVIKEPEPNREQSIISLKKVPFYYPEGGKGDKRTKRLDAEALFWARGNLYLLTKQKKTKLYRFDSMDLEKKNPLTLVDEFDVGAAVTGADASEDGGMIAVLTYESVWLFEISESEEDDKYFHGKISWLPIFAGQCEGVCFDDGTILLINEAGELFELAPEKFIVVKE